MTSNGPGSAYHLSSLRYAQGSKSNVANVPTLRPSSPVHSSTSRRQFSRLFQDAEDGYRPGQSKSSSLLIRSNAIPTDALTTVISEAREGFQRTKVRSILAQSVPMEENQGVDEFLGIQISDIGSSIYLHNRRAKNPMSRASYDRERKRKRIAKQKAKIEKAGHLQEQEVIDDDDEEEEMQNKDEEESKAEKISREMQADADLVANKLPSGSLMETTHYLAAHYYGARGLSRQRETSGKKKVEGQRINMWRSCEGSALVALAVYLEEVIKYESTAEPDQSFHRISSKDNAEVADQLAALQRDNKNKKRRKVDKKVRGRGAKKLLDHNWAKIRRRKKPKRSPVMASSEEEEKEAEEENEGNSDNGSFD